MRKPLFYKADFINLPGEHEDGSIMSYIKIDGDPKPFWDGMLKIRDCSNYVNLSIHVADEHDLENALYKIQVLIDHLTELKVAIDHYGKPFTKKRKKLK